MPASREFIGRSCHIHFVVARSINDSARRDSTRLICAIAPTQTLVILPTYDEATNICDLLVRVREALPTADILVVDDNSPDGTADLAEGVATKLGRITVLRRERKEGLGIAYRAGFERGLAAGYDVIVHMDADLSHDPAVLPSIVAPLEANRADMVIGSRYVPGGAIPHWPTYRRLLSRYGNLYARLMLGYRLSDATSGYRAYRASTLDAIDYQSTRSRGYGFMIETAYRVWLSGLRIVEVPIVFTDRVRGYSKMSLTVATEEMTLVSWWGARDALLGRRRRASRLHRLAQGLV